MKFRTSSARRIRGAVFAFLIALTLVLGSSYALYAGLVRQTVEVPATVNVIVFGGAGDCNGDTSVGSADITAVVLEIFDGDGAEPGNASEGTFAGTAGCDANEDGSTCVVLIIFNGPGSCGAGIATTTMNISSGESDMWPLMETVLSRTEVVAGAKLGISEFWDLIRLTVSVPIGSS